MSNLPSYASSSANTNKKNTPSYASSAVNSSVPSYASSTVNSSAPSYASGNNSLNTSGGGAPSYAGGNNSLNTSGGGAPSYASGNTSGGAPSYASGSAPSYVSNLNQISSPAKREHIYGSGNFNTSFPTATPVSTPVQAPTNYNYTPPPSSTMNVTTSNLGNYGGYAPPKPSNHFNQPPPKATESYFNAPPQSTQNTTASHFSAPPSTITPETASPNAPKKSSGGGLFAKVRLKAGQMGGHGVNMAAAKVTNVSRKLRAETDLEPPPGGFVEQKFEELCTVTKFTKIEEIEFLYYEFKRHVFVPEKKLDATKFIPTMNFEQFANMMPPSFNDTQGHYKFIVQSFFKVFKWGTNQVIFDTYAKAMSTICRGSPSDKLPILYDVFMDPVKRTLSTNSFKFVLGELIKLGLPCTSAGNVVPQQRDVDYLIQNLFGNNQIISMDQFTQAIMRNIQNPQVFPPWKMLLDGFGIFPYFYFTFFRFIEQVLAKAEINSGRRPHKEGFMLKFARTTLHDNWTKRWAVLDSGFLWWYPPHNDYASVSRVMPLNEVTLMITNDPKDPPYCFILKTANETQKFCAMDEESLDLWLHCINLSKSQSIFPNHSFSPIREGMSGRWFIDGEDTYRLMEETMLKAKKEIFITDWFFSPQVYVRRFDENGNPSLGIEHRLDVLLQKKANEGVKIYVLPWSETKIAIDLGSANVKAVLEKLSPNIKVLCHPLVAPIKWSHHQKTVIVDQKIAFVGGLDLCFGRWDTQKHSLTDTQKPYIFPGKDYYNPAVAEFSNVPDFEEELVDRFKEPRMPWHDIHMMCEGDAARDVAGNFIQRWNHHRDILKEHKHITPNTQYLPSKGKLSIQVVRSVCEWSAGVKTPEKSIENAYLAEIDKAERFIYIENQFFISSLAGGIVENRIAEAILHKVFKAIDENRPFKVIIIVPVHPEGNYKAAATVRYIMGWQFKTMCRGSKSMVKQFQQRYPQLDMTQYFNFYVVKKWDRIGDNLVHEQIYVHAKLMIVDDRTVIVGSANINDRSMMGVRDSEIAVVVKDRELLQGNMAGQPFQVARFAHELRCNLYIEHLGMQKYDINQVRDPIHPTIYNRWVSTARRNAEIFNELFYKERTIPFSQNAFNKLQGVVGHITEFDQDFLSDSEMSKTGDVDVMLATDDVFT